MDYGSDPLYTELAAEALERWDEWNAIVHEWTTKKTTAEAVALARGLGLDPAVVIDALSQGAAGSFMLTDRGPRMLQAYTGGAEVRSRIDIFTKDMGIVTSVGKGARVPLPLSAATQQLFMIAEAAGLGAADDSSVVTVLSPDQGTADS